MSNSDNSYDSATSESPDEEGDLGGLEEEFENLTAELGRLRDNKAAIHRG